MNPIKRIARKVLAKEIEQQANKIEQQANRIAVLQDFAKLYLPEIKANGEDQTQAIQQHVDVLGAVKLPEGSISVPGLIRFAGDFTDDEDEKPNSALQP